MTHRPRTEATGADSNLQGTGSRRHREAHAPGDDRQVLERQIGSTAWN